MRKGISTPLVLGIVVLVFIALSALLLNDGGVGASGAPRSSELYAVGYGSFDIKVPASGELASEKKINIRNLLESGAVLVNLVDEGDFVKEGDVLFELNDEEILENIRNSEINLTTAINNMQNAETTLAIAEKRRDSELAVKQLNVDLARLSLQAWREGELVSKRQGLGLAVKTAEKNYQRLLKKYESSMNLYEQKFLSKDELDRDEIALLNADATLKKAKLDVVVYENYIYLQEKQKKESDLQQAKDELDRSIDRLNAEILQSKANLESRKNQLEKREEHLQSRREQLEKCIVLSPAPGMVVYASSLGDRREEDERLRVGRQLYKNQLVMVIPDTSNMVASVKVNEALSGLVKIGQRSTVVCDAYPDKVFDGEVVAVGVLATGGGWRDPNRRDYTVTIKIENLSGVTLKPSMRCSAEIYIERIDEQLHVPIHTVHREGNIVWVWKKESGGFSQHPVEIGKFSELYIVIKGGLTEGDVLLLREPSPSNVVNMLTLDDSQ